MSGVERGALPYSVSGCKLPAAVISPPGPGGPGVTFKFCKGRNGNQWKYRIYFQGEPGLVFFHHSSSQEISRHAQKFCKMLARWLSTSEMRTHTHSSPGKLSEPWRRERGVRGPWTRRLAFRGQCNYTELSRNNTQPGVI